MTQEIPPEVIEEKLILSGIHLDLTDAIKAHVREKVAKLLRHEPRIVRVRLEIEYHQTKSHHGQFTAKGHIEISGPDLNASDNGDDAYVAIDKVVSELDRQIRKRSTDRLSKRNHPHAVDLGADLPKAG
ncbi:ribosome hibernation-promoting factor, HPF/YfiA family [Synoicihabitans lomoniglobus]|uniref:Ribosome hibernation promoting factor n=1 Tax=Synoicihabitans lomoniglobus TaxID=2909285 RepID=A0AAF0CN01_9BACT|nr:ribosome-associated translation inhibitor RaiA [Opitutaceae bacterium LMO-M01]WED63785.1 ribosome-associated translation inhibitor RaiA [Opitutaceae bacterium LMO-M01]